VFEQAAEVVELHGFAVRLDPRGGKPLVADDHAALGARFLAKPNRGGPADVSRAATGDQDQARGRPDQPGDPADALHATPRLPRPRSDKANGTIVQSTRTPVSTSGSQSPKTSVAYSPPGPSDSRFRWIPSRTTTLNTCAGLASASQSKLRGESWSTT